MNNNPDWAVVLEAMYECGEELILDIEHLDEKKTRPDDYDTKTQFERIVLLKDKTDLNIREINKSLRHLYDMGLIERYDMYDLDNRFGLSNQGFMVAHQRKMRQVEMDEENLRIQSQNEVNTAIGFLTLGILFVTYADTTLSLLHATGSSQSVIVIGMVVNAVIILLITLVIWKTGLLNLNSLSDQ